MKERLPDIDLTINPQLTRKLLVRFIRDEIRQAGFAHAVIGLSGGIDSALTCYLTAEALGPENVVAVRMPYRTSSEASLTDAAAVIEATGVNSLTVEITPMVEPLFERFPDADEKRRGNVMARQRMIVLYDQSAAVGGLVVGTGNKTETLLGYTTLYGDSAAALIPLADLYKTQVRQLSRAVGVPDAIIDKPPSADLWVGQTDEAEMGFSYERVDQLLYLLVDRRFRLEEAVTAGFARDFVDRVWHMVRNNQFKRRLPLTPKLSDRSVGHDFLYPRDWGV